MEHQRRTAKELLNYTCQVVGFRKHQHNKWISAETLKKIGSRGKKAMVNNTCTRAEKARAQMLFLMSELANKAETTILSARDTTKAWVPDQGIMGMDVGV